MEWTVEGEDVLFQCRAVYKNREGTLFATNKRVAWYQTSANLPQISLPLELLKGLPKSNKEGSEKVLLKFEPKEPIKGQKEFLFAFSSGVKATDREGVVRVMGQLLGRPQPPPPMEAPLLPPVGGLGTALKKRETKGEKAIREAQEGGIHDAGDARRRAAALAGDVSLRMLYEELVTSGLISEDEFWHNRRADLDKYKAATASQVAGPESQLVSDLRPYMKKDGELHYRLTSAIIAQIFRENPVVRRAYETNVPLNRTENEFWTEYLQSRYVETVANKTRHTVAGDIFAEAEKTIELERRKAHDDIGFNVDLRLVEGEVAGAEDANEPAALSVAGIAGQAESVIQRFNHHSALVLSNIVQGFGSRSVLPSDGALEDDLNPVELPSPVTLAMKGAPTGSVGASMDGDDDELLLPHFDDGGARPMEGIGEQDEADEAVVRSISEEAVSAFKNAVLASSKTPVDPAILFKAPQRSDQSSTGNHGAGAPLPPTEQQRTQLLRVQELSRHYWGCFPITSQASVTKCRKIIAELKKQRSSCSYRPTALMMDAVLKHAQTNAV